MKNLRVSTIESVTRGYTGYKGLQGVTRGYKGMALALARRMRCAPGPSRVVACSQHRSAGAQSSAAQTAACTARHEVPGIKCCRDSSKLGPWYAMLCSPQKPSTENWIILPAMLFLAWSKEGRAGQERAVK